MTASTVIDDLALLESIVVLSPTGDEMAPFVIPLTLSVGWKFEFVLVNNAAFDDPVSIVTVGGSVMNATEATEGRNATFDDSVSIFTVGSGIVNSPGATEGVGVGSTEGSGPFTATLAPSGGAV